MTWTELHEACEYQLTNKIVEVARHHPEFVLRVDDHGSTPLHILCLGDGRKASSISSEITAQAIQAILEACPSVAREKDFHGNTPLHIACSSNQSDKHIVKLLLEAHPEAAMVCNKEGLQPLHMACRYAPDEEVIGLLIEFYPKAVQHCIKMGSPAPKKRRGHETDHAVIDHNEGMAQANFLKLRYENVSNQQVRDGAYPIHMAIQSHAPIAVLEMLVKAGSETSEESILLKRNKFGETPLHIALRARDRDEELGPKDREMIDEMIVEMLLKSSPDSSRIRCGKEKGGNLPIHLAAMYGCSVHVAKDLLETWPESIHEKNGDGLTPMELANRHGHCSNEVMRLFAITDAAT